MPDRLPPPPFWRTRYFAEKVINKPGRQIDPAEISATLATPARRVVQPDGRVRHLALGRDAGSLAAGGYRSRRGNRAQRVLG